MALSAEYRKIVGREHESPKVVITPLEAKIACKYVDIIYNTDKFNREEKFVHASVDEMKDFLKTKDKDVIIHEEIL